MCLPIEDENNIEIDDKNQSTSNSEDYIIIDQRQNGSQNYRINIDGVIIALSPLEPLLAGALDDFDFSDEFESNKPSEMNGAETNESTTPAISGNSTENAKSSGKVKR